MTYSESKILNSFIPCLLEEKNQEERKKKFKKFEFSSHKSQYKFKILFPFFLISPQLNKQSWRKVTKKNL